MQAAMKTSNSRWVLMSLAILLLASCSGAKEPSDSVSGSNQTNKSPITAKSTSLVLADGITVTKTELEGSKKYIENIKKLVPDASADSVVVAQKILQLGAPAEKFKNDGTMQAIMTFLDELKTDSDLICLIRINKAISDKEFALGESKNNWLCRLTRSTIWLSAVRGSLMRKESGSKILLQAKSALAPLDGTETRDFAGLESYQRGLK